jgi:hypothetical protein
VITNLSPRSVVFHAAPGSALTAWPTRMLAGIRTPTKIAHSTPRTAETTILHDDAGARLARVSLLRRMELQSNAL